MPDKKSRIDDSVVAGFSRQRGAKARLHIEDDDTLPEVGEEQDFEFDDEIDPGDRRLDPLRQPR